MSDPHTHKPSPKPNRPDRPTDAPTAGIRLTRQEPAAADLRISLTGQPPSEVWSRLTSGPTFISLLTDATEERLDALAPDAGPAQYPSLLLIDGIDACDGAFTHAAAELARPGETPETTTEMIRAFGSATSPLNIEQPLAAIADGPIRLFERTSVTPTLAIRVGEGFTDQRASQRRGICRLLMTLAEGCDVRVVCGRVREAWLRTHHREDLPVFSDRDDRRRGVGGRVAAAADALAMDGTPVRVLDLINSGEGEARAQKRLATELGVTAGRVSQVVSELRDLELVETFARVDGQAVALTAAGSQFVEEEIAGRRATLGEFSDSGQSVDDSRVTPRAHGGGEDGPGDRGGAPVDVAYLDRGEQAAVVTGAPDGGIALCDAALAQWDRTDHGWPAPRWGWDPEAETLVAAAEVQGPLQYWVSIARVLTSRLTLDTVFTDDRLADGDFGGLLSDAAGRGLLRDARCLGYLSDDVETAADYRDALVDAHCELLDLTREMKGTQGDERDRLRSDILRLAHGLVGVIVHLADLAGITVVREARIPEFTRDTDASDRAALVTTLTHGALVQSRLGGHYAAYRQLVEDRDDKRQAAPGYEPDAADPYGDLLGSIVIVGDGVETLADPLRERLSGIDPHEDAPETAVDIPVQTGTSRGWAARVVASVASAKHYRATREAVSTLWGLVGCPFAIATGLMRGLAAETESDTRGRDLRADEIRRALAALPRGRVCPDLPPSARSVVETLCRAGGPLPTADLTDCADVSARSLRRHRETLLALGIIDRVDAGWRLALSFADESAPRYPAPVSDEWTLHDAYLELAYGWFDPETFSAAAHPVLNRLFGGWSGGGQSDPPDAVRAVAPWDPPWDDLAHRLTAADRDERPTTSVCVGTTPDQQALPGVAA